MEKKIVAKPFATDFSERSVSDESTITATLKKLASPPKSLFIDTGNGTGIKNNLLLLPQENKAKRTGLIKTGLENSKSFKLENSERENSNSKNQTHKQQSQQSPIKRKIQPPSLDTMFSNKKNNPKKKTTKKKKQRRYSPASASSSSSSYEDDDLFRNDDDDDKNTFSTFDDNSTLNTDHAKESNIFNSKKERNKFLSKIISKSKKKVYRMAGCFLTPFLLFKLIVPDLPIF